MRFWQETPSARRLAALRTRSRFNEACLDLQELVLDWLEPVLWFHLGVIFGVVLFAYGMAAALGYPGDVDNAFRLIFLGLRSVA